MIIGVILLVGPFKGWEQIVLIGFHCVRLLLSMPNICMHKAMQCNECNVILIWISMRCNAA